MLRIANPSTPVRFRPRPPLLKAPQINVCGVFLCGSEKVGVPILQALSSEISPFAGLGDGPDATVSALGDSLFRVSEQHARIAQVVDPQMPLSVGCP